MGGDEVLERGDVRRQYGAADLCAVERIDARVARQRTAERRVDRLRKFRRVCRCKAYHRSGNRKPSRRGNSTCRMWVDDVTVALVDVTNRRERFIRRDGRRYDLCVDRRAVGQRSFTIFLLVGILLLLLLIFVMGRLRVIQKRANHVLEIKNQAIEQQKEEMEAQAENLQQLNRLKSKLFSVISHDIRGPIANLQSLLELLTNRSMASEEFFAISDKLKSNLDVTQRTLENLLNWSLSQMDGIKTELERVEIKCLLDEGCRLMDEAAKRKNVTIENTSKEPIYVVADPNQIQLILRNLIHNAIKFSKEGGKVLISAHAEGSRCCVQVKDFGIGMTKAEIGMIMASQEYFTRAGTQQEKGTGLGLLLCKEFIMRHGGTLNIESFPGKETTASFTLQIAQ